MNILETLRGLLRRWYITFPGLVLAIAAAVAAWTVVPVEYERTATQLLLPGKASMPDGSNPFLYLGGLSYPTDVLVRALGSENVVNEVADEFPQVEIAVGRDGSTSSPVVIITATSADDAQAGQVLDYMVERTSSMLGELQKEEGIPANNQITVTTLTIDAEGQPLSRNRLIMTAAAAGAVAAASLLLASLVDGVSRQRRRRGETAPGDEDPGPSSSRTSDAEPENDFEGIGTAASVSASTRRASVTSGADASP